MKRVISVLSTLLFACLAQAQDSQTIIKAGGGYTHDFPGLNGYTIAAEAVRPFGSCFEAGFGIRRVNLVGHPRTTSVTEHTKATTLDFSLYFLPLNSETHVVRLGLGYNFSFYSIRRSYPVTQGEGHDKTTLWNPRDQKGRTGGVGVSAEYEYLFPESNFSLGLRASVFKAYDRVSYMGPFVGLRI